jgi:hypothetical protein
MAMDAATKSVATVGKMKKDEQWQERSAGVCIAAMGD